MGILDRVLYNLILVKDLGNGVSRTFAISKNDRLLTITLNPKLVPFGQFFNIPWTLVRSLDKVFIKIYDWESRVSVYVFTHIPDTGFSITEILSSSDTYIFVLI